MHAILAVAGVVILEMIRRKDVYVLLILTGLITLSMGSVSIFGDDRTARHLKELCLALIWLSSIIISVISAARQLPSEKESRTLLPLLAKPISRTQVMAGKFFGCWAASCLCLLAFYTFFTVLTGSREQHWPLVNYLQAFWLHCLFCGIVIALTLLGSVYFAAVSSAATIVSIAVAFVLILGRHLHKVAEQAGGVTGTLLEMAYFALPHLEWYDVRDLITHNWPRIEWGTIAFDTMYGAAYAGLFLALACLRFRKWAIN